MSAENGWNSYECEPMENDTLAGISTELLEQAPCHYCGEKQQ